MRTARHPFLFLLLILLLPIYGWPAPLSVPAATAQRNISFENELNHALDRGLAWLLSNQNSNGWWSTPDQPAVTALVLTALKGHPQGKYKDISHPALARGYSYLLSCVQPDGGIYKEGLVTYNTSIAILALLAANNPEYHPIILKARKFLTSLQRDFNQPGQLDSPFDGGIGYGTKYDHSDMGNTTQALEALHYSRHLLRDHPQAKTEDLNWAAAIHFLQNCQNLTSHNQQQWASDDPENKGGFIYYPGHSMAGSSTNTATGRVALRSYGSISYAGLLSYIYADLDKKDPRVTAVYEWLRRNYTLEENPGMGPQGLFYYFHTMTKALTAIEVEQLTTPAGTVDWRKELSQKLLNLQQKDGSWMNENGRWWERDPALVTAYCVLSLEMILRGMQKGAEQ
jgi:squalene-hopene/tetraprenyl-beta-curcumene cyclase